MRRRNLGIINLPGESKAGKARKEMMKDQPEQRENEAKAVSGAGSVRALWAASNRIAD